MSFAAGSLFRRTAHATTTAYVLLFGIFAGTTMVWVMRDAPFGHTTVQAVLSVNPMAAALSVIDAPGFSNYELIPINWWFMGWASVFSLFVLVFQTWRLTRPQ